MERGALILMVLVGAMLGLGCGAESQDRNPFDAIVTEGESGCSFPMPGTHIELRNSGLQCEEAVAISLLLSTGFESRPQTVGTGKQTWICRAYSNWKRSREVRCRNGGREFRLERMPDAG